MNEPFLHTFGLLLDLISFAAAVGAVAWLGQLLASDTPSHRHTMTLGISSEPTERGAR